MFEAVWDRFDDMVLGDPNERLSVLKSFLSEEAWPAIEAVCQRSEVTYDELFEVLDGIDAISSRLWAPVGHCHSVQFSDVLTEVVEQGSLVFNDFSAKMNRHRPLFEQLSRLSQQSLNDDQQRVVSLALKDLRLAGCDLPEEQQELVKEVKLKLSQKVIEFNKNVIKSAECWELHITDEARLSGLPEGHKALFAKVASDKGLEGWCLTLGDDVVSAVLSYADDASLREELYKAYMTRASDVHAYAEPFNNDEVITQILSLRSQLAQLLGFEHYVDLSFAKKMAPSGDFVIDWLLELLQKAKPKATKELQDLKDFAESQGHHTPLASWDIGYWHERLKQHKYQVDEESLRAFFPLEKVKEGIKKILAQLFQVRLEVQPFQLYDEHGEHWVLKTQEGTLIGDMYLDLLRRDGKQSGAWMNDFRSRSDWSSFSQRPACHVVGNFMPSVGNKPIVLSPREVETLFHELGHGIHHVLSQVSYSSISGISGVAWDAVEVPSQWFEFWARHPETLPLISEHIETGEPIDAETVAKLNEAQHMGSGRALCRQIEFALFDLTVHGLTQPSYAQVREALAIIQQQCRLIPAWSQERFQNAFRHIFGGGYAAGYYSYKWAEVLSCDVFAYFEQEGLMNQEAGLHFLDTYLGQGGRKSADKLFYDFRQRAPQIDALLKYTHIESIA